MTQPTPQEERRALQLALLARRFESITRKMANTLFRTARSGVINIGRDFSCCVVTAANEVLVSTESLPIHVLSGYRSKERSTSRHAHARAVDFRVPGVDPKEIWEALKRFDDVGLGWYPTSKFVHRDVREKSAYWIDDSGPGQRARYRKGVPQGREKKRRTRAGR